MNPPPTGTGGNEYGGTGGDDPKAAAWMTLMFFSPVIFTIGYLVAMLFLKK